MGRNRMKTIYEKVYKCVEVKHPKLVKAWAGEGELMSSIRLHGNAIRYAADFPSGTLITIKIEMAEDLQ